MKLKKSKGCLYGIIENIDQKYINKVPKNCLLIDCSTIDIDSSKKIGKAALFLGSLALIWLILGMINIVPLFIELPEVTRVRAHASLAVLLLLIGSWAFWNED